MDPLMEELLNNSEKHLESFKKHLEEHKKFMLLLDAKFIFKGSILSEVLEEEENGPVVTRAT